AFQHWITYPASQSLYDSGSFFVSGAIPPFYNNGDPWNAGIAHTGFVRAVLGNANGPGGSSLPQTIYQDVTIPAGMAAANLSFYLKIDTFNTSYAADAMSVELRDLNDNLLRTIDTYTNKTLHANSGYYFLKIYDMTNSLLPYRGKK